jgi:predicted nuclease of predicted toxin-antitoxin system
MRFLADESCDFAIVRALRGAGHDVEAITELAPASEDFQVIERAVRESRVLLTEDKDFGQLVYAGGHASSGVVLVRFPVESRPVLPAILLEMVRQLGSRLKFSFVVLTPRKIRIRDPHLPELPP